LEPWQRWDTLHYQAIAEQGYAAFDTALFVPPAYPLLMWWLGTVLGGQTLLAGIIIANLAYLAALVMLYRLTLHETGDADAAQRTIIYLASFPAAFFFLAAYTESLFLLAGVMTLYAIRREMWWPAGVATGLAALSRVTGALAIAPLAYAAWVNRFRERRRRAWGALGLALLGAAAFPLYIWLVLHLPPWTPLTVQGARFAGGLTWPGASLIEAAKHILAGEYVLADMLDLAFLTIFLVCALPVWRRLPRIYGVYYLAFLALYLTRIAGVQPLLGMARYVLSLFPAFMLFGLWGRRPWVNRAILYASWAGLLFMSGQFAIWGWVG